MSLYIMDSFDLYNDIIDKHMGVIWKATENAINAESEWISATEATATVDNNNTPKTTKSKGGSKAKTETPIDNESVRHAESVVKASGSDVTKDPNAKPETKTEKDAKESKDNANMSIIDAIGNLLSEVGKMIGNFFSMLKEKLGNIANNVKAWINEIRGKKEALPKDSNGVTIEIAHSVRVKARAYDRQKAQVPIDALARYVTNSLRVLSGTLKTADVDKIANLDMDGLRLSDMIKMSDAQIQAKIFSKIPIAGGNATSFKDFQNKVFTIFYGEEKLRTYAPMQVTAFEKIGSDIAAMKKSGDDPLGVQTAYRECEAAQTALSNKVQKSKYDMSGSSLSQRMNSVNKGFERMTKLANLGMGLYKLQMRLDEEYMSFGRGICNQFYKTQPAAKTLQAGQRPESSN